MTYTFTASRLECPWIGTSDAQAAAHTKTTKHATQTHLRKETA